MFDEQNQNPNAPKNLPTLPTGQAGEPVDMFAGVEKDEGGMKAASASVSDALSAGLLKKKDEAAASLPAGQARWTSPLAGGKMSAPVLGKILLFLVTVLLLGGLAYGAWWLFYGSKNKLTNQADQNQQTSQNPSAPSTANTPTNIPAQINNDQILFGQAVDSDKDGLDDVREKEIGTDPRNLDTDGDGLSDGDEVIIYKTDPLKADTDGDGLSDGDEVLIWRTNPLNADTDGDSYPDGTEVRNGYSPLGPGKLFNSSSTTTTSTS